jgi:hypothetical protein
MIVSSAFNDGNVLAATDDGLSRVRSRSGERTVRETSHQDRGIDSLDV